jgi:hypothetical protein
LSCSCWVAVCIHFHIRVSWFSRHGVGEQTEQIYCSLLSNET